MKRSRRGGRRPQHSNGGSHNAGGGFNPNRTFDSSGPEVKIRGSASHVYEKYLQLARDANSSGDRVMACGPSRGESVLVDKILATSASPPCAGVAMPKRGSLSSSDLQTIVDWIAQGAPQ